MVQLMYDSDEESETFITQNQPAISRTLGKDDPGYTKAQGLGGPLFISSGVSAISSNRDAHPES
ncbi:hypothetical protein E6P97_03370 [Patescibacteria group bacterium]|nr:MAG: hypothetical protein E6P97_03370 [Patescibacteria group bacterium]